MADETEEVWKPERQVGVETPSLAAEVERYVGSEREIQRIREVARTKLAYRLLWLLIGTTAAVLVLFALVITWDDAPGAPADVGDIAQIVLPPVVALVGTVLGFYFGGERS